MSKGNDSKKCVATPFGLVVGAGIDFGLASADKRSGLELDFFSIDFGGAA